VRLLAHTEAETANSTGHAVQRTDLATSRSACDVSYEMNILSIKRDTTGQHHPSITSTFGRV
jgi:hypothetical protein